jgi:hypothetical protein
MRESGAQECVRERALGVGRAWLSLEVGVTGERESEARDEIGENK